MALPWSSDLQGMCLKHPDRRPSPGVCSVCLKERLTQLSNCKPSCYYSSTSYSYYFSSSCESSSPSTPPSWAPPAGKEEEEGARVSSLISKEGKLPEMEGRLWPLRRSRSAAVEVKKAVAEKKKIGGGGLWSLLLMKRRKDEVAEKAKGRRWRFAQSSKVVRDVLFLGVRS